jgi:hypothetical protein
VAGTGSEDATSAVTSWSCFARSIGARDKVADQVVHQAFQDRHHVVKNVGGKFRCMIRPLLQDTRLTGCRKTSCNSLLDAILLKLDSVAVDAVLAYAASVLGVPPCAVETASRVAERQHGDPDRSGASWPSHHRPGRYYWLVLYDFVVYVDDDSQAVHPCCCLKRMDVRSGDGTHPSQPAGIDAAWIPPTLIIRKNSVCVDSWYVERTTEATVCKL